jgi:hypothetical protein
MTMMTMDATTPTVVAVVGDNVGRRYDNDCGMFVDTIQN